MATRGCKCDPCEVERVKCAKCMPCVKKHLCLSGTYTPPYGAADCPYDFTTRLFWDCANSGWRVLPLERYFDLPTPAITMRVVAEDYPVEFCGYDVETIVGTFRFSSDETIEFSFTDSDGGFWDCRVGGAGMIKNPLISCGCDVPCYCASCLPTQLCAFFPPNFCLNGLSGSGGLAWNGSGWDGSIGDYDIVITLADCSEGCFARIVVGGPDGSGDGTWGFEGSLPVDCERPYRKYKCKEGPLGEDESLDAVTFRKGGTDGCQGERTVTTYISTQVTISDPYGQPLGTIYIEDNPCGAPCSTPSYDNCKGSCGELSTPSASCPAPTLTATIFSDSCEHSLTLGIPQRVAGGPTIQDACGWADTAAMTAIGPCQIFASFGGGLVGSQPLDNYAMCLVLYYINHEGCSNQPRPGEYRLRWSISRPCFAEPLYPKCLTGDSQAETGASCSPVEFEFDLGLTWGDLRGNAPHCVYESVPCDIESESVRVRITQ